MKINIRLGRCKLRKIPKRYSVNSRYNNLNRRVKLSYRRLSLVLNFQGGRYTHKIRSYSCNLSSQQSESVYSEMTSNKTLLPESRIKRQFLQVLINPYKKLVSKSKCFNQTLSETVRSSVILNSIFEKVVARPILFFVFIPWFITMIYMSFFKSPIYEANARILLEKNDKDSGLMINLGFLGQSGSGVGGTKNVELTKEFIVSRDMFEHLDRELRLKDHFQSKLIDYFSRLSERAKSKKVQSYFESMIEASVDPLTNEISIYIRAYDPIFAYRLIKEVIEESRLFANRISNSLVAEQYNFTEKQLKLAKAKLYKAEKEILAFQNRYNMFDPEQTIKEVSGAMSKLKGKLVEKQTSLIAFKSFMDKKASKIVALKKEIQAIKNQLKKQTEDLLGQRKDPLNSVFAEFSWLKLNLKFATAEYEASQQALSIAKVNLAKQQDLLIEVLSPHIPDDYEYPHLLFDLFGLLIGLLVIFSIGRMSYIIVQEHID